MDIKKLKEKKSADELLEFGIINIDKPSGPTSFDISDFVRKKLGLRKTSHFGTLDPKVTGVLPIALNRACKFTGFFLGEDKEYVGIMRFHEEVELKDVEKAIKEQFTGTITQLPPVKSRVKRQEREREIKNFKILEKNGKDFLFKVECQGGTYIRKLVHDLGGALKIGAHMLELRRTRAGIFEEKDIVNLYDLEKAIKDKKLLKKIIIPGEIISKLHPVVQIKKAFVDKILHGSPIYYEHLKNIKDKENASKFCAFEGERFIGIYKVIGEEKIFARPEFVLQPIGGKK
ncbi:MAG TPA: RNA-guided pseudouridylation complex pseudouridine synthase subunit Cbf5 [Bacillota bacterium]|nr:RNA-guided pseudouridylation complex pseudouridine synthase subunit Cbf5 [Bacillota bacterium]